MKHLYSLLVFLIVCVDVSAQDSPISNVSLSRELIIKADVKDTIKGIAQIVTDFEVKNGVASLVKTKVYRVFVKKGRWEDVDCGKLNRMYPNIDICEQIDSFCVTNKKNIYFNYDASYYGEPCFVKDYAMRLYKIRTSFWLKFSLMPFKMNNKPNAKK